jgi:hypothetical protein
VPTKLGLVAGGGGLPRQVVDSCREQGREIAVIAFDGTTDKDTVAGVEHLWTRLGAVGKIIDWLKASGAEEIVLAGRLSRPSWSSVRPDMRGMKLLPRIMSAGQGDDSILSVVIEELEGEGFRVVGIHDVMPSLLAAEGALGHHAPDQESTKDIDRGVIVARALGGVDVGQAVVVQQGVVLGVEAAEGTDGLIDRCAALQRKGDGGVLVKCVKPGQERRADLPSIGPDTVRRARDAGLSGIAVGAGTTLVLDQTGTIAAADEAGMFLVGVRVDG